MDATFDLRILSAKILKDGYLEPEAAQMLTDAADYLDWLHEVLWLENEELSDKLNSLTLSHTEPKL
tara:strand:+ start:189 stop:386 length:198 start_codon:yes stop_codon:yes gene_type:complete